MVKVQVVQLSCRRHPYLAIRKDGRPRRASGSVNERLRRSKKKNNEASWWCGESRRADASEAFYELTMVQQLGAAAKVDEAPRL